MEIKEKPVEKCYLLSVSKVSYGRETTGTCEVDGTPTPIHRLVVYHLKGAWTTRNRDVAFALFNSLVKNQVYIFILYNNSRLLLVRSRNQFSTKVYFRN